MIQKTLYMEAFNLIENKKIYQDENLDIFYIKSDKKKEDSYNFLKELYKNVGENFLIKRKKYHRPKNILSKYNYSITYVKGGSFIAFGKGNFAIDAEEIKAYDKNINKILKINPKNEKEFFEFFTRKEALIKLNNLMLTNILDDLKGYTKSIIHDKYMISIAREFEKQE